VAAVVAAGVWVAAGRGDAPASGPGPAVAPSPVVARIQVAGKPRQLALDADALWVVAEHRLHRIDPSTRRVVASVPVGAPSADLGGVAVAEDTAWVPEERSDLLWRVDRATNRVNGRARLGKVLHGPVGVATLGNTVWVTCCALEHGASPAGMLLRVDGRRLQVTARVPVPDGPLAVVADRDAVWVGTARGSLLRVDPASARVVTRVPPPDPRGRVQALSAVPGGLWVADTGAGAIRRFDLASGRYDLAVTAPAPRNLGAGDDGAYVVTDLNQLLSRVDARTGRRSAPVPLRHLGGVRGVAVGPGAVWVTTGDQVVLVDPARLPG
jgi:streptogramin lyase